MKKFLSTILILLSLVNPLSVWAAGSTAPSQEMLEAAHAQIDELLASKDFNVSSCSSVIGIKYDLELIEFFSFLEDNFQSKSANSSLTNLAIAKYRLFKTELRDIFASLEPSADAVGVGYETKLREFEQCSLITDAYIELAKEKMIDHIRNTTAQKRTTIFVEKYQSINSRMRDMQFSVAKMFALYSTFKNRLPGFLSQCL